MTSASDRSRIRTEEASSAELGDRLERLSVPQAERVLERAIELEAAGSGPGPNTQITASMLERIAAELDIDVANLRRALDEERLRVEIDPASHLDRLLGPRTVTVHGVVPGEPDAVRQVVDAWMTSHEGMRKRADHDGQAVWERDRSFGATLTQAFGGARGTGAVRRSPRVVTSVRPGTATSQVLVVSADTGGLRLWTSTLLVLAALAGAGVAGITSLIPPTGTAAGEVLGGLATFAAFGTAVIAGGRMWLRRLREGAERVLDAVKSPHLVEPSPLPFGLDRVLGVFRR